MRSVNLWEWKASVGSLIWPPDNLSTIFSSHQPFSVYLPWLVGVSLQRKHLKQALEAIQNSPTRKKIITCMLYKYLFLLWLIVCFTVHSRLMTVIMKMMNLLRRNSRIQKDINWQWTAWMQCLASHSLLGVVNPNKFTRDSGCLARDDVLDENYKISACTPDGSQRHVQKLRTDWKFSRSNWKERIPRDAYLYHS